MIKSILKIGWWAEFHTMKLSREGIGIIGKIFFRIVKFLCIVFIQLICFIKYKLLKINPQPLSYDKERPIVSLTTYPARIQSVWLVLLSIFYQTYRPSKILLILTQEEFPGGRSSLPESVRRMEKLGVEIIFQPFNLKPHNKYYYALSHVKDQNVITIDDDLFYWSNTIELLMNMHRHHPTKICANATYQFTYENGILFYKRNKVKEDKAIVAMGVGGVLYPTNFRSDELFNKETIKRFLLNQDDNWLKIQQILLNIHVHTENYWVHPLFIMNTQKISLRKKNTTVQHGGNTYSAKQMQKTFEYYNIDLCRFFQDNN